MILKCDFECQWVKFINISKRQNKNILTVFNYRQNLNYLHKLVDHCFCKYCFFKSIGQIQINLICFRYIFIHSYIHTCTYTHAHTHARTQAHIRQRAFRCSVWCNSNLETRERWGHATMYYIVLFRYSTVINIWFDVLM